MLLGIILLVSFLRLLHLGFPLERDEGEFGYIAQEMLRGVPMYESAHTQKLPGTYLFYTLFLGVFGQSITAIHVGLLLANVLIMVLIFLTLRETHSGQAGCIGALVFGVMALSPTVFGFAAHATFFVALFAVAGLYALLHARQREGAWLFFWSGLCFGLAFLMKQSGLFFAPLAVLLLAGDHLLLNPRRPARFARQAVALVSGALAPMLVTAVYYAAIGKLPLLWFWAFQFASGFGSHELVRNFLAMTKRVATGFELLWILPLVGLVVMLRDRALGRDRYLYATFAAGCLLSIVPGFHFLPHYCITVLPAVALLVGALLGAMERHDMESGRGFGLAASVWALTILGLTIGVAKHDEFYFGSESDLALSRRIYLVNPFAESLEIGEYLKNHTTPEDRIAILGSETQILFYSQRRSVSRFVNTYFLTADHPRNRAMQWEFIHDIERARPKYLVVVNLPTSWLFAPNSPQDILRWGNAYIPAKYEVEGLLTVSREGNVLKWGADARGKDPPPSGLYVEIRRRLDPAEARDSTRVRWPAFR